MIGEVENVIIARIADCQNALGYNFRTLEPWPDNWQEYFDKRVSGLNFPAAWVTFTGLVENNDAIDARYQTEYVARFGIVVAAKNSRNQVAARHGVNHTLKPDEIGVYQLSKDLIAILNAWRPLENSGLLAFKSLQPGDVNSPRAINIQFQVLAFECALLFDNSAENTNALNDFAALDLPWEAPIAEQIINLETN